MLKLEHAAIGFRSNVETIRQDSWRESCTRVNGQALGAAICRWRLFAGEWQLEEIWDSCFLPDYGRPNNMFGMEEYREVVIQALHKINVLIGQLSVHRLVDPSGGIVEDFQWIINTEPLTNGGVERITPKYLLRMESVLRDGRIWSCWSVQKPQFKTTNPRAENCLQLSLCGNCDISEHQSSVTSVEISPQHNHDEAWVL